jgi:hypothetical protein
MSQIYKNITDATVDELLSNEFFNSGVARKDSAIGAVRLKRWCEACTGGNQENFSKRLALESLTLESVLFKLSNVEAIGEETPSNSIKLGNAFITNLLASPAENFLIDGQRLNEPLLRHLIYLTWVELSESSKKTSKELLGEQAVNDLKEMLFEQISELAICLLEAKKQKKPGNLIVDPDNPEKHYTFERLLSTSLSQWLNVVYEFLVRLSLEYEQIALTFFDNSFVGIIHRIELNASDLHNKGHSVYLLHLENGEKLVYKPKDLNIDSQFYNLVSDLNSHSPKIKLKAAKVISMSGYGWSEFIHHNSCNNQDDIKKFYIRSGGLLALFHVLIATDMHEENIIACGDYPIPVDLEMLLQPYDNEGREAIPYRKSYEMAVKFIEESVAMVGL